MIAENSGGSIMLRGLFLPQHGQSVVVLRTLILYNDHFVVLFTFLVLLMTLFGSHIKHSCDYFSLLFSHLSNFAKRN